MITKAVPEVRLNSCFMCAYKPINSEVDCTFACDSGGLQMKIYPIYIRVGKNFPDEQEYRLYMIKQKLGVQGYEYEQNEESHS